MVHEIIINIEYTLVYEKRQSWTGVQMEPVHDVFLSFLVKTIVIEQCLSSTFLFVLFDRF